MKIFDLMATDLVTCAATDSLNRAAQLMWERRCGSIPVIDESGRPVGLVTDRDVSMAAYTQGRRLDDIEVATAMSRPVRTCPATATAEEAEGLMMAHGIRRLLVVDPEGILVGLVSIDDIARHASAWDGKGDIDLEGVALAFGEISRRTSTSDEDGPAELESNLGELVRNSVEALKTLRHEIGIDLELANEELRKRWTRLEARLWAAEIRAQERGRDGPRHLAALVEHARQFHGRLPDGRRARATRG